MSSVETLLSDLSKIDFRLMSETDYEAQQAKMAVFFQKKKDANLVDLANEVVKNGVLDLNAVKANIGATQFLVSAFWMFPVLRWLYEKHQILPTIPISDKNGVGFWIFDSPDYNGDCDFLNKLIAKKLYKKE